MMPLFLILIAAAGSMGQDAGSAGTESAATDGEGVPAILRERVAVFDRVVEERALTPFRRKTDHLAVNYGKAIQRAIDRAADSGDLPLVNSFKEEQTMIRKLRELVPRSTPQDLPALPAIPEDAAPAREELRRTWKSTLHGYRSEYHRRVAELTLKFAASLEAYESELTRDREFDLANAVMLYRKSITGKAGDEPERKGLALMEGDAKESPGEGDDTPVIPEGELRLAGQYQPVPLGKPFPLPKPDRPNEPCRVVAWRLDGKPVDRFEFETMFYSVPAALGNVVDLDMWERMDRGTQVKMIALTPEGKLRTSYARSQPQMDHIAGAVRVAGLKDVGIALLEDGTCQAFSLWSKALDAEWASDLVRVREWKNVVAIDAGERHVLALMADGTPLSAGDNNGSNRALFIPGEVRGRTCRIEAQNLSSNFFVVGVNGNDIEIYRSRNERVEGRRIPRASRFFGPTPRVTDIEGRKLNMYSELAHQDGLVGSKPSDVTFAHAIGGKFFGELCFVALVREGRDVWRFWGDPGKICDIDAQYCNTKARYCRKIFLNPPYAIGLKPYTKLTEDDWTGEGDAPVETGTEPVTPLPEYANAFPLQSPERPKMAGRIEIHRRDGKPLDREHPEVAWMPSLGKQVVDFRVRMSSSKFTGIALLEDGTVRAWGEPVTKRKVDLSPLKNIVRIEAGYEKFITLNETGEVFFWHPGGTKVGRLNLGNEPIRRIALTTFEAFLLTESGKVLAVQDGPKRWMAEGLPPAVDVRVGWEPYILGVDGRWRTWSNQSNNRVRADFESGGVIGEPFSIGAEVFWIDRKGELRKVNRLGAPQGIGEFENKKVKKVKGGNGLIFVQNQIDRWGILGGPPEQRELLEPKIQGSLTLEITSDHVFCLKR